ncbi:MAG: hypothetical protein RR382_12915 [Tannerellaceae bacterium]
MARLKPQPKINLTAIEITKILNRQYLTNPRYLINNLYVFGWESDYLALTRSGYWHEVEVKISKADFKKDFEKKDKHTTLISRIGKLPNYFSYCAPKGMLTSDDIPDYAGLIEIDENGSMHTEKLPPKLHSHKILYELNLMDKFYYNYSHDLRDRLDRMEKEKELRARIRMLEEEFKAVAGYEFKESL